LALKTVAAARCVHKNDIMKKNKKNGREQKEGERKRETVRRKQ
jgi:hypothetical protein